MRMPRRERTNGFTLVELMLVVAIIGILGAIAIPAMSRQVKMARTSEVAGHFNKLWSGAVAYYEADHANAATVVVAKQFPIPLASTHECTPPGSVCAAPSYCGGLPDGLCPGNSPVFSDPTRPWMALSFNIPDPHRYAPLILFTGAGNELDVEFQALGNLDGDTITSLFRMRGSARSTWGVASARVEPWRSPIRALREIE